MNDETTRDSIHDLISTAREDLKEAIKDGQDVYEAIHEIADGAVPVYNYPLVMLFADDLSLLYEDDEIGGETELVPMMQRIVYQRITSALWEVAEDYKRAADLMEKGTRVVDLNDGADEPRKGTIVEVDEDDPEGFPYLVHWDDAEEGSDDEWHGAEDVEEVTS